MSQYVYIQTEFAGKKICEGTYYEHDLFTVGFYDPEGKWQSHSDHGSREEAERVVKGLNSGPAGWHTEDPPKDGTPIVAVGRVIWSDEFSTTSEPFCAAISWQSTDSGFTGWCHHLGEYHLAVARSLDDEVKVDAWMPWPKF